jgi:hypothetical protein
MVTTRNTFSGDEAAAFLVAHPIDVKELQWK